MNKILISFLLITKFRGEPWPLFEYSPVQLVILVLSQVFAGFFRWLESLETHSHHEMELELKSDTFLTNF